MDAEGRQSLQFSPFSIAFETGPHFPQAPLECRYQRNRAGCSDAEVLVAASDLVHELPSVASIRSFHVHSAEHAGFAMTRYEARELEFARLAEFPDHLACLVRGDPPRVGVGVAHFRICLHRYCVL
jgi:hypothetical protein